MYDWEANRAAVSVSGCPSWTAPADGATHIGGNSAVTQERHMIHIGHG